MAMDGMWPRIEGSGGGGGGKSGGGGSSGRTANEDPNDLQSKAVVKMVEVIGEGQIVGFPEQGENAYKYVFLDNVPVRGANGLNFQGFSMDWRVGLPDQTPLNGFDDSTNEVSKGTEIKKNLPQTAEIFDTDTDAVSIKIRIPALTFQSTENGDLSGSFVNLAIDISTDNGPFVEFITTEIRGKTTSTYERGYRFSLPKPASQGWTIRVRRLTDDSTVSNLQNKTFFSTYTEIVEQKFIYPDTAVVGIQVEAEQFGSNIPSRTYEIIGRIVQVPSNYFPATRKYTRNPATGEDTNVPQPWNGYFYPAWTDNPAWILLDLITNPRYGLGENIRVGNVDTAALYQISKYADVFVPSGRKNPDGSNIMEPRFTFNGVITGREDAYKVIQSLASSFRGIVYWSTGSVFVRADMPSDPVREVNPSNVIDGEISYSGTSLKSRHTSALVTYNEPEDNYLATPEPVEADPASINALGWKQVEVIAYGCTVRGQAHRLGRWILDTEINETETVTYRASWDHASLMPGDIIRVHDPDRVNTRNGGRILSSTQTSITLDAPVNLVNVGAITYSASVYFPVQTYIQTSMPNGGNEGDIWIDSDNNNASYRRVGGAWQYSLDLRGPLIESRVTNGDGSHTVLNLEDPFPPGVVPSAGSLWGLIDSSRKDLLYRVMGVKEVGAGIYEVAGLIHDPEKYNRVENGVYLDSLPYDYFNREISPPSGLTFSEMSQITDLGIIRKLRVSWTPPNSDFLAGYRFKFRRNNDSWTIPYYTYLPEYFIEGVLEGTYDVTVESYNSFGRYSVALTSSYTVGIGGGSDLLPPINLRIVGTTGVIWGGLDILIEWDDNPGNAGLNQTVLRDYQVNFHDADTDALLRQAYSYKGNNRVTYFYADNVNDGGPRRSVKAKIRARDTFSRLSNPAIATFNNPVPEVPDLLDLRPGYSASYLRYAPPTDTDFAGVILWASTVTPFTPVDGNKIYDGADTAITFVTVPGQTYYLKYAGYDVFGKTGLNISSQIVMTTPYIRSEDLDFEPPLVPVGLTATTGINDQGESYIEAAWTGSNETDFSMYDIHIKLVPDGEDPTDYSFTSFMTAEPVYRVLVAPNSIASIKVRSIDRIGNKSAFTTPTLVLQAASDTVAPSAPTDMFVVSALRTAFLTWMNPSDDPYLSHIEVWSNGTGTLPDESTDRLTMLIGTVNGVPGEKSGITITGLTPGSTRYFWTRAVDASRNVSEFSSRASIQVPRIVQDDIDERAIQAINLAENLTVPEIVTILPNDNLYEGRLVFLRSDGTLYRYKGAPENTWTNTTDTSLIVGEIQAGQIATGAVTTRTLAVGDFTNFTENGNFERGDTGWNKGIDWNIEFSPSQALAGEWVATRIASSEESSLSNVFEFAAAPGDRHYGSCRIRSVGTGSLGAAVAIQYFNAAGLITTAGGLVIGNTVTASSWTLSEVRGTAPVGTVRARVQVTAANRAGTVYVDNIGIFRINGQTLIDDGSIATNHISVVGLEGEVIKVGSLHADRIITNTIEGSMFRTNTSLPGTITVGNTGVTIDTVQTNAADPAVVINAKTTRVDAGKILVQGGSALNLQSMMEAWRHGTNNTLINGGSIAANTVRANSLEIGSRNLTISEISFSFNKIGNVVEWTGGTISYPELSDGSRVEKTISDSSTSLLSARTYINKTLYIYWVKDDTSLTITDEIADASGPDKIILATYRGGVFLVANYGKTLVDGDDIITNTIRANRILTGSITTQQIEVTEVLRASNIVGGFIDAATIFLGDTIPISKIGRYNNIGYAEISVAYAFQVGQVVGVAEVPGSNPDVKSLNGTYPITGYDSNTRILYFSSPGADLDFISRGGKVTGIAYTMIDGAGRNIRVFDGLRDRVRLGKLVSGDYGLELKDGSGNLILSTDGVLGSSVYIGTGNTTLQTFADNAAVPTTRFVGTFSAAPNPALYQVNAIYKNSTDRNSYIRNSSGQWELYLSPGQDGDRGPPGETGAPGSNGAQGYRGSRTFYLTGLGPTAASAEAAWIDSIATNAASVLGGPMPGDVVTQSGVRYPSGVPYSVTRFWNGTIGGGSGSWTSPGVIIDGNLLVTGSIGAAKLSVGDLSAISGNLGTITAGYLQSPDGNFVIDLNGKYMRISV